MSNNPKARLEEKVWGDPVSWARLVRAQTPRLVEVGKPKPKVILSFGGAAWLVTYSLGVAEYLANEQKDLLAESYIVGAGTGVIPAAGLACGVTNFEKVKDFFLKEENLFNVHKGHKQREELMRAGCKEFLPLGADKLMNGKVALTIGMNNRDLGFRQQKQENLLYGHHISMFDSNEDITDCMVAAIECDVSKLRTFRGVTNGVQRGSCMSMSSQVDQYIRHIYIHGLCGYPYSRKHMRHNNHFGRHGMLVNTHAVYGYQFWQALQPCWGGRKRARFDELNQAFENGFHDARRYERWEEDVYHYAKPDRSVGGDEDWKNIRVALFGSRKKAEEASADGFGASQNSRRRTRPNNSNSSV